MTPGPNISMDTFRFRGKHWGDLGYRSKCYGTHQPCPHSGWTWKGHVGPKKIIKQMTNNLAGVPSIVFGLFGMALFVNKLGFGDSILAGGLTLGLLVLPIVIRTTEESLKVVPDDYRYASLALGASKTQTTFKVILPNAFSGILTATILAIGRIIGESAALVFAIGTAIKDEVSLTDKSTSLAVHIWAMMTDEPANIELSTTIAIIILIIVLSLNISVKFISKRMIRKYGVRV